LSPSNGKEFRNNRTAALSIEILARERPKSNDLSNLVVASLCVVIILSPLAALLLLAFKVTLGG
jgi:hypothetical protein